MTKHLPRILLLFIIVFLITRDCYAQNTQLNPNILNMTLPSPSAAALGKFGSIPVSPSNGIPKINIPIFERQGGNNKCGLSISLDYHAGGVRVDEIASNVGLGWALNAGGVITRTINGNPDELDLASGEKGFLVDQRSLPRDAVDASYTADATTYTTPGNMILDGRMDGQIDDYSFNFNGRSGKFFLGKNGDVLITPQQKLIIEKTTSGSGTNITSKITITTEDGFKYEFADQETSYSSTWTYAREYPTAWYLSKIISPNGADVVTFQYETFSAGHTVSNVSSEKYALSSAQYTTPTPPYTYSNYQVTESGNYKRLLKIQFSDLTEVNFSYDAANRTDWASDKALNSITISNNNRQYKKFDLKQKYSSNRLFLDKVILKDATSAAKGEYAFDYNRDAYLPERLSANQDHWGFPARNTDGRMIPAEYRMQPSFPGPAPKLYEGGYRNASSETITGTIKKIAYPTGGYTLFEMEANDANITDYNPNLYIPGLSSGYDVIGGARIRKIQDYDGLGTTPAQTREFTYTLPDGKSSGVIANYPHYSDALSYDFKQLPPTNRQTTEIGPGGIITVEAGDVRYPPVGYWSPLPIPGYGSTGGIYHYQPGYREPYQSTDYNVLIRSSSSLSNLAFAMGSPVTYQRVEEKISGTNPTSNGKTVRIFSVFGDYNTTSDFSTYQFPHPPPRFKDWLYGLMKQELVFDSQNRMIKKTENNYDAIEGEDVITAPTRMENFRSVMVSPIKFTTREITKPSFNDGAPVYWQHCSYYPATGRQQLSSSTSTTYANNGDSVVVKTTNTYDPSYYYIRSQSVQKSNQALITTTYKYPKDMITEGKDPAGIFQQMANLNIINPMIEQTDVLSKDAVTNQLKWIGIQYFNPTGTVYAPKSTAVKQLSYPVDTISKFNRYDSYGNILEQQKAGGPKEVYLWSYSGQYPVAKIINSDYITVSSIITQTQIDNAAATDDATLRTLLNTMRTDSRLKNAQVTTFTYAPQIGITSMTDVKGETTTFEYDSFQRLMNVKDKDGNIVNNYRYNYANSATDDLGRTIYYNVEKRGDFTKNNCPSGGTGGITTYTVSAKSYSSIISQADADQKAQDDVNRNGQQYANTNGWCTFFNTAQSGVFTRNTCSVTVPGSTVTYTVPAGKYSSPVSQADADQKAKDDVNTNGQSYANTNGICATYYNTEQKGDFTKNNCGAGYTGTTVSYIVPDNTYSSAISVDDANQKAKNDIAANGQNNANAKGSCNGSCSFAPAQGWSILSGSLTNLGTAVSFNIRFSSTSGNIYDLAGPYTIASIIGSCAYGNSHTFNTIQDSPGGSRNWQITLSGGTVSVKLLNGPKPVGSEVIMLAGGYSL